MDDHGLRATLQDRTVLIVHENAFVGRYIADVIADHGATILARGSAGEADAALLGAQPSPAVLVLSEAVEGGDVLAEAAKARGVAVLLLQPSRLGITRVDADRAMHTPFSGFQVAEAVAELIHDAVDDPRAGGGAVPDDATT